MLTKNRFGYYVAECEGCSRLWLLNAKEVEKAEEILKSESWSIGNGHYCPDCKEDSHG